MQRSGRRKTYRWGRHTRTVPVHVVLFELLLALVLVGGTAFVVVDRRLRPTLTELAQARARALAVRIINQVVREKVGRSMRYEDLYAVRTDSRGKVVLMQPNTGEVNRVAAEVTESIQNAFRQLPLQRLGIPLGQVLGSQLLASVGPTLVVRVLPVGTVETNIFDRFEQAGINQTRHKLYVGVKATIRVVVPFLSTAVDVRTEVPISESIILGEVPQVYFGLSDSSFSLFPSAYSQKGAHL
ncbi:MAG: sporulation protein YunB [Bacillota bacterium]|nr:sporulation protein YunB [Bacillota bacterium]